MKTRGNDTVNLSTTTGLGHVGFLKREYFAAFAMQGLLANSYIQDQLVQSPLSTASKEQIAQMAVNTADALIAALNKDLNVNE